MHAHRRPLAFLALIAAAGLAGATLTASAASSVSGAIECLWGGGLSVRNGVFRISPGLHNTPSDGDANINATGALTGDHARCTGTVVLDATLVEGSGCLLFHDSGRVYGLPGVHSVAGAGNALSGAALRNAAGEVVGNYVAIARSADAVPFSGACASEAGLTEGTFGAVIVLYP